MLSVSSHAHGPTDAKRFPTKVDFSQPTLLKIPTPDKWDENTHNTIWNNVFCSSAPLRYESVKSPSPQDSITAASSRLFLASFEPAFFRVWNLRKRNRNLATTLAPMCRGAQEGERGCHYHHRGYFPQPSSRTNTYPRCYPSGCGSRGV